MSPQAVSSEAPVVDLGGKRAIVTGASSGIGAEIARELLRSGADVVLVGRDAQRLEAVGGSVSATGRSVTLAQDMTEPNAADRVVAETVNALGGIDVIASVAGIMEGAPFPDANLASFDRQWAINVRAPFALTLAAVPYLRMGQGGSVLLTSSVCGHVPFPSAVAYCTTKSAVEMMARTLAVDLGPHGIRVNAIAPGWTETPLSDGPLADADYAAQQLAATPLGRIGSTAEVARVAAFLLSDAAPFMHGMVCPIDGGFPALVGTGHR